jgi:hypothetical protein
VLIDDGAGVFGELRHVPRQIGRQRYQACVDVGQRLARRQRQQKCGCDRVYQINRPVRFEFNHPNRCEIEKLKQFLHRCCWSGDHVLNAFNDQEHALMTRLVQQPEAYRSGRMRSVNT